MKYIKELDAVRGFAILSVITTHWSDKNGIFYAISSRISGPFIFLTISGFLITSLLIRDRLQAEELNISKLVVFKSFFLSRAFRIFPAYYLTILGVYILSHEPIANYIMYFTFSTNFLQHFEQSWGIFPHFWSMAVEEQFYIIWPWIILFTPQLFLLPTFILFIAAGIISRVLLPPNDFTFTLPHTCFDALGLGALLAWFTMFKRVYLPGFLKVRSVLASISFLCMLGLKTDGWFFATANRTFVSIITTWGLTFLVINNDTDTRKSIPVLNNPLLIMIGKMSYGLFLFHLPLLNYSYDFFYRFNNKLRFPNNLRYNEYVLFIENFVLLLILAWLSWKFIERPIVLFQKNLRIKKFQKLIRVSK